MGGWDSCCIGFIGSHKSVFKESKVAHQAVTGDARYPSGVSSSHCMSHAPCSYGQDMIAVECEHKLFILYGSHLLVHTEMNSQLPCKIFRKLNKSLLSTLITKCGVEMALSTTFAFSLGQAVPYLKSAELTLPAESMLEAVQSWRDFVSGAINLLFGQQDFTLLFPPARWMHLHVACCHAVSSSWEPGTWRSFPWKQKTLRA